MRITLQFFAFLLFTVCLTGQNTVSIQINHLLDGEEFEFQTTKENNLGNRYKLDRLEYYLSNFEIKHDGGQVTQIKNLYVLVDLSDMEKTTTIELGEADIENLESVSFYFGVDEEANHGDPSAWPSDHPLAPKFPSMHWGWAAGYRFIAYEGKSGSSLNQDLQFHCIGDEFHQKMEFPLNMGNEDSYLVEIDAEYNHLVSDININGGFILHGGYGEMINVVKNLTEKVFTSAVTTSTNDNESVSKFNVYPNPSIDGTFNFDIDVTNDSELLKIYDAQGKQLFVRAINDKFELNLSNSGLYLAILTDSKGQTLATRKIIVQ